MTAFTIFAASLFIISLVSLLLGLIVLILPTVKKIIINISTLTLILTILFINLVRDITKAIKYVTIG